MSCFVPVFLIIVPWRHFFFSDAITDVFLIVSQDDPDVEVKGYFVHGANILGLIVYSLILGLGLIHIGEKEGPIARLMIIVNIITKKYFNLYLW